MIEHKNRLIQNIKINKNLKIEYCEALDFDYILNQFVLLVKKYEDLSLINPESVFEWKSNKLKSQVVQVYSKVIYNSVFAGVFALKDKDNYYELDDFYITESLRNMGIGSEILRHIIDFSKNKKKNIHLCVFKNNLNAIRLYGKFGFIVYEDLGTRIMMKTNFFD